MVILDSAGVTDVGKKRKGNEDSLYLDDNLGLYIVADGMGGHKAGEVASRLVVDTIKDYMIRFEKQEDADELADYDETLSKDANRVLASILLSNKVVHQFSEKKSQYRGMGSTVSTIFFADDRYVAANVGDSPMYLIRDDILETISVMHTVKAEQEALHPGGRVLGPEFDHMLTRAVGTKESVTPDVSEQECQKGDIFIMCSDGLSDKVSPEEILPIAAMEKPDKACAILRDMALDRGGDDNITIVIARVKKIRAKKKGGGFLSRIMRS